MIQHVYKHCKFKSLITTENLRIWQICLIDFNENKNYIELLLLSNKISDFLSLYSTKQNNLCCKSAARSKIFFTLPEGLSRNNRL